MVSEMNRSSMSKQMMSKGGKLNMVKGKDGKMVPDYAADGKGKMKAGGMAKAYKDGGGVKKPKNMSESDYMKMLAAERKKENKSVDESKLRNSSPKPVQGAGNMPLTDKQAAQQIKFLKSKKEEKKRKPMDGGAAMPMMKKGGKVRGAGMAKKGVRACKMR
jgi:hypothetical protein